MAIDYGKPCWYFMSFLTVGVAQHPMIVGISLPLYSVCFGPEAAKEFNWLDGVATVLCLAGIGCAFKADNDLRDYMLSNAEARKEGRPVSPILNTGLWRYSRHPNYFGEQLWWWALALFAINVG